MSTYLHLENNKQSVFLFERSIVTNKECVLQTKQFNSKHATCINCRIYIDVFYVWIMYSTRVKPLVQEIAIQLISMCRLVGLKSNRLFIIDYSRNC